MGTSAKLSTKILKQSATGSLFAHRFVGSSNGPCVALVSGVHGDEWYGPASLNKLIKMLKASDLSGTVIVIPAANPLALAEHSRLDPTCPLDLNRSFVFDKATSPSEHNPLAKLIWREIADADVILDVHSCGVDDCVDHVRMLKEFDSLATSLGVSRALVFEKWPSGLLIDQAFRSGKRALALEFGTSGSLSLRKGKTLTKALMAFLGATKSIPNKEGSRKTPKVAYKHTMAPVEASGIFEQKLPPGLRVKRGDVVGTIRCFQDGESIEIQAPVAGDLLMVRKTGPIGVGNSACTIV